MFTPKLDPGNGNSASEPWFESALNAAVKAPLFAPLTAHVLMFMALYVTDGVGLNMTAFDPIKSKLGAQSACYKLVGSKIPGKSPGAGT